MKHVILFLWIACVILVFVGFIGFIFFSGEVVDSAKTCAGALADVCENTPVSKGISAGGWGMVVIGGVVCGAFAILFNRGEK